MTKIRSLLTLVFLTACAISWAQDFHWIDENGKPAPDLDNMKAKNGFGAALHIINDQRVFDEWEKTDPPKIPTTSTAERNKPIFAIIVFAGAGRDNAGNAEVKFDMTVRKPDGAVYGEQKAMEGIDRKPAPPPQYLQLAPKYMGIRIEPRDPKGTYMVEAIVRDTVRKVELKLKNKFTVEK